MKKRNGFAKKEMAVVMTATLAAAMLAGCSETPQSGVTDVSAAQSTAATDSGEAPAEEKEVLRVGMECAYAPFNWTQDEATTPDGSAAVPIYDSTFYAYGYDVAVAQMIADELGMDLEIHKVEWSSIGISMDAGDYDCIIAGMGRTAEREIRSAHTSMWPMDWRMRSYSRRLWSIMRLRIRESIMRYIRGYLRVLFQRGNFARICCLVRSES